MELSIDPLFFLCSACGRLQFQPKGALTSLIVISSYRFTSLVRPRLYGDHRGRKYLPDYTHALGRDQREMGARQPSLESLGRRSGGSRFL